MSEKKHYETLGLDENSSFEEIQGARNRLIKEHNGDRKQLEAVETAYDAILMDRLRLRQEGKIKVPDRIRFPERPAEPSSPSLSLSPQQAPDWAQQFLDTPSQNEILWPAIAFSCVALLGLLATSSGPSTTDLPTIALTLGTGFCFYFLLRKENKFFRSLGFTLLGLVGGVALGSLIYTATGNFHPVDATLPQNLQAAKNLADKIEVVTTAVTFWVVSCFLR